MSKPQVLTGTTVGDSKAAEAPKMGDEIRTLQQAFEEQSETRSAGRREGCPASLPMEEVYAAVQARTGWLWHGYLAAGNMTLLTSQWKTGKTTLLSILLAKLKEGGTLAGRTLNPGKALVISEEGLTHWSERGRKLGIGNHVRLLCRPFGGKPKLEQWLELVDHLEKLHAEEGIDLVVIDTLASFFPGRGESNADCMLEALAPLQQLANRGMSVLIMHHPRKGESVAGQSAPGSGALPGYVDIIVEMSCADPLDHKNRRRRLRSWSRYEETPAQVVIELNAEGTDYLVHGDFEDEEFMSNWEQLRSVLEDATEKMTRREILKAWPSMWKPPSEVSLWRWLERAIKQGLVCQDERRQRNRPLRYWLPGKEEEWTSGGIMQAGG